MRNLTRVLNSLTLTFACLVPALATAQSTTGLSLSESRILNREIRRVTTWKTETAAPPIAWALSGGLAYTDGENNSKTTAIPMELSAQVNGGLTTFSLGADAYSRTRLDGDSVSGTGDVTLRVVHMLSDNWLVGAGVTVPTGSDISAGSAGQAATIYYTHEITRTWSGLAVANVNHSNGDFPDGISSQAQVGILRAILSLDKGKSDVWLQVLGVHRKGASAFRAMAAGYEFPISKSLGGSLSYTRGLTRGARDNSIEFDVTMKF